MNFIDRGAQAVTDRIVWGIMRLSDWPKWRVRFAIGSATTALMVIGWGVSSAPDFRTWEIPLVLITAAFWMTEVYAERRRDIAADVRGIFAGRLHWIRWLWWWILAVDIIACKADPSGAWLDLPTWLWSLHRGLWVAWSVSMLLRFYSVATPPMPPPKAKRVLVPARSGAR